jgi:hypothetical protein
MFNVSDGFFYLNMERMMQKVTTRITVVAGALAAILASQIAMAWDGTVAGTLGQIDVTAGTGLGFRVYMKTPVAMCGNANQWAYLNSTDSNYSVYVAALLMAKTQGSSVTIYSSLDSSAYCHIIYITQS